MTLDELNTLDDEQAIAALLQCCGSSHWAQLMASARPFADPGAMTAAADRIWASLGASDYREAFAAHPRIGSSGSGGSGRPGGSGGLDRSGGHVPSELGAARVEAWSDEEQAGVRSASVDVQRRLADANRDYEARFGYIFIVCATGKTAAEMLALLEARLHHAPDEERAVAAEEQRKITRLRLLKLLADTHVTAS
jgi:2-oxo-4-hydroxy-4-carboxy-5-ureidoimidazoline decarboxylase